jgi:endonuclease/exonuclease/phosphatase family metal-dependent hydrolase
MRIVSYNTRGSLGMDGKRSTRRIASVVRGLSPDVVCFQEIHQRLRWSGNEDQPEVLGTALNRRFEFQSNLRFGFGGYGIGIAYRGDLVLRREHRLPGGREPRGALELKLRNVGGLTRLTVFCTHWGLSDEERWLQAEALSECIQHVEGPVVVGGDLNETADRAAVQRLLALTGLVDLGAMKNEATFVSENPTDRIDFLLVSGEFVPKSFEVVQSTASDHLPVLADLVVLNDRILA